MKAMGQEFDFNHSYMAQVKELIKRYVIAVHYIDDESKREIEGVFKENSKIYLKSDAVYILWLYESYSFAYSANCFQTNLKVEEHLKTLKKVLPTFNSDLIALVNLTEAMYLENQSKYEKALACVVEADSAANANFLPEIKSEILNAKLRLFIAMGRITDALETYEHLRSVYERENNYSRMLTLHYSKATIYMLLNSFQKADLELDIALDKVKCYSKPFMMNSIINNKIWCALNLKEYRKTVQLIFDGMKQGLDISTNIIFLPLALYKLNQTEDGLNQIKKMRTEDRLNDEGKLILKLTEALLKSNTKTYFMFSSRLIRKLVKCKDYMLIRFFINLEIDELEKSNDVYELNRRRKLLLNLESFLHHD